MREKFKSFIELFNAVFGVLHNVGSPTKIVALWTVFGIVAVWIIVGQAMEYAKKIKEKHEGLVKMENKHPDFFRFLYSGKVRFWMLVIAMTFFLIDWRDATSISPPIVQGPPAPIVKFVDSKGNEITAYPSKSTTKAIASEAKPLTPQPMPTPPQQATGEQPSFSEPSARAQLEDVTRQVQKVAGDWRQTIINCECPPNGRCRGPVMGPQSPENDRINYLACILKKSDTIQSDWFKASVGVCPVVHKAMDRMLRPGSNQVAPNYATQQEDKCVGLFNPHLLESDIQTLNSRPLDKDRFQPNLDFLGGLDKKLGDYPENLPSH
ncbi:hypothetical protein P8935_11175 [Telmatobacter sp. DSM 110680]|uniref:Uncharacterized protein n=1 Tax=Telmatobacter sp. DSM 110680 TaxID=3036704 RepID=A0AAU7DQD7_9BACT